MNNIIKQFFPNAKKIIKIDLNKFFVITEDYSLHFILIELTGIVTIDKINEDILELISLNYEKLYELFNNRI